MAEGYDQNTQKQLADVWAELRRIAGAQTREERLMRGPNLTLRHGQTHPEAVREIKADWEELQEDGRWVRRYPYRPVDGRLATYEVLTQTFGSVKAKGLPGGFFYGPTPPTMEDVEVGPGVFKQAPVTPIALPMKEGMTLSFSYEDDSEIGEVFVLVAEGKKLYAGEIQGIFALVGDYLDENSIYRGKAIDDGYRFLDLRGVDPAKVVYAEATMRQLEDDVFCFIRHTDALLEMGEDLKAAILLEGTFGTGKTLAAYLVALEAEKNGWGFILVRPSALIEDPIGTFKRALQTAQMYGKTVIFVEDVETLAGSETEAERISVMLDLFDGVRAKGHEVMTILTTNRVEEIDAGMIRNGRIDTVIPVPPPDEAGIIKLCKVLVGEKLDLTIPDEGHDLPGGEGHIFGWDEVGKAMFGFIPATVAAACSNATRAMVWRTGGEVNGNKLNAEDLVRSAEGLHRQKALLEAAIERQKGEKPERLGAAFRYSIEQVVEEVVENTLPEVLGERFPGSLGQPTTR